MLAGWKVWRRVNHMVLQAMESYITGTKYVSINHASLNFPNQQHEGGGVSVPHSRWMISQSSWDVLTFYLWSMASRWVGCVQYWRENGCDHCGYMWVCPYLCMWVHVGSGSRSLAVRHHILVLSEQGGYEYCWIWCKLIKVWMAKWWRVWCRWQQCANFCVWWLWVVCPCLRKEL